MNAWLHVKRDARILRLYDRAEEALNEGLGLVKGQFQEVSAAVLALTQGNQARGSNEHVYLQKALNILDAERHSRSTRKLIKRPKSAATLLGELKMKKKKK